MEKKLWQEIFMYALAGLLFIGVFGITYMLITNQVPEGNKDALLVLLGVLASGFMMVVGYFFGSSKGSSDKNNLIKKA